jgi:Ser-tRNA(Ala) deacylase AlaX
MKTELIYLLDPEVKSTTAKILHLIDAPSSVAIILDRTTAYPQGGGQSSDVGYITSAAGAKFAFTKAIRKEGHTVHHIGRLESGSLNLGEDVIVDIDWDTRHINSRYHTAGEIICASLTAMGFNWPLSAACHFPGQSRVAFRCDIDLSDLELFRKSLLETIELIVGKKNPVIVSHARTPTELAALCPSEAEKRFDCWPVRMISPMPDFWRPCLGVHCQNTGEVGVVQLNKIRIRGGEISVGYEL